MAYATPPLPSILAATCYGKVTATVTGMGQSRHVMWAADQGVSDESRREPDGDGGDDHHRPEVDGALLVAGGQPAPLFEAIDTAFNGLFTNDKFCLTRR